MARSHFLPVAIAAVFAALSASPALAQNRVTVGQTVQGSLDRSDPTLGDGSHFDCYLFDASGSVTITARSTAFDTVLMVGVGRACGEGGDNAQINDDGPNMGTNSQVVLNNARGPHWIVVNSYSGGETGAYSLSLQGGSGGGQVRTPPANNNNNASANPAPQRPSDPQARYQWDAICKAADTVAMVLAGESLDSNALQAWINEAAPLQRALEQSGRAIGKTTEQQNEDVAQYGVAWLTDQDLQRNAPPAQMREGCLRALR